MGACFQHAGYLLQSAFGQAFDHYQLMVEIGGGHGGECRIGVVEKTASCREQCGMAAYFLAYADYPAYIAQGA